MDNCSIFLPLDFSRLTRGRKNCHHEVKECYRIRILDSDQGGSLLGDLPDQATKLKLALRSSIGRSVDRQLLHFSPTRL